MAHHDMLTQQVQLTLTGPLVYWQGCYTACFDDGPTVLCKFAHSQTNSHASEVSASQLIVVDAAVIAAVCCFLL